MLTFILSRLSEPSTWRGICMCLTAGGVAIEPEWIEAIVSVGIGTVGLIGMITADKVKL